MENQAAVNLRSEGGLGRTNKAPQAYSLCSSRGAKGMAVKPLEGILDLVAHLSLSKMLYDYDAGGFRATDHSPTQFVRYRCK